jgi:hypothetical protein
MEELTEEQIEELAQAAWAEACEEVEREMEKAAKPCRACGEVADFWLDPQEEFCVGCRHEFDWMRQITLARDRWCPHCGLIQIPDTQSPVGVSRDTPPCLSCGESGLFPQLDDGLLAHLCFRCEAKRTFACDIYCPVCDTVDVEHLRVITDVVRREWEAILP